MKGSWVVVVRRGVSKYICVVLCVCWVWIVVPVTPWCGCPGTICPGKPPLANRRGGLKTHRTVGWPYCFVCSGLRAQAFMHDNQKKRHQDCVIVP